MGMTKTKPAPARARHAPPTSEAEIVREHTPVDEAPIHGVTFDGTLVWFARTDEIVAFDPRTEKVVKRLPVPSANAGTAFDGEHIYQLAHGEILVIQPSDGRIVRTLRAPDKGLCSGMAWADGYLWIGQFRESRIHKVDAKTGEVLKTLASDRFVTGVSCVDGAVWHGASGDGKPSELRRLASDGTLAEVLTVPVNAIAGVESNRDGAFWCGGSQGKLRLVRKRAS